MSKRGQQATFRTAKRSARLARTVPVLFCGDDFTDIGVDYSARVTEDYETPQGRFTGEISWVRIDIGNDARSDPGGMEEAAGQAVIAMLDKQLSIRLTCRRLARVVRRRRDRMSNVLFAQIVHNFCTGVRT
jgi:hypothetical protein